MSNYRTEAWKKPRGEKNACVRYYNNKKKNKWDEKHRKELDDKINTVERPVYRQPLYINNNNKHVPTTPA